MHVVVTQRGLPLNLTVGAGNQQDWEPCCGLLEGIQLKGKGSGRPKQRPREVFGDGAYDTQEIRDYLKRRGIKAHIRVNRRKRMKPKLGRGHRWVEKSYHRVRNSVERFFAWLKGGFRRLAIRYERLLSTFVGFLYLACFVIAWRLLR